MKSTNRLILEIENGLYQGFKIWLLPNQHIRIGSSAYADYQYFDSSMSGVHCLFSTDSQSAEVRDLQSRSGTFANGRRIDCEQVLKHNDIIRAGNTTFRVFLNDWVERPLDQTTAPIYEFVDFPTKHPVYSRKRPISPPSVAPKNVVLSKQRHLRFAKQPPTG